MKFACLWCLSSMLCVNCIHVVAQAVSILYAAFKMIS